jgi:hypothetical protein
MTPLDVFTSDELRAAVGTVSSPRALRRYLLRSDAVKESRKALSEGRITEETIRLFADRLMGAFERGTQFPHELALAALAVTLESRRTKFAEDFLLDLARLGKISEMDIAPRVAGLSLTEWHKAPKVLIKVVPSANRLAGRLWKLRSAVPRVVKIGR